MDRGCCKALLNWQNPTKLGLPPQVKSSYKLSDALKKPAKKAKKPAAKKPAAKKVSRAAASLEIVDMWFNCQVMCCTRPRLASACSQLCVILVALAI